MSTNEQEKIQKIDLSEYGSTEQTKSVGIKQIEGKVIHINGFNTTRGKPTKFTKKEDIGDDERTDYHTITTQETFNLSFKDEGVQPINGFFVTKAIASQINRVADIQERFKSGAVIGPCKPVLRKNNNEGMGDYWCLAFPNDDDYGE